MGTVEIRLWTQCRVQRAQVRRAEISVFSNRTVLWIVPRSEIRKCRCLWMLISVEHCVCFARECHSFYDLKRDAFVFANCVFSRDTLNHLVFQALMVEVK